MASTPTRLKVTRGGRCESWKITYDTHADALDAAEKLMERGIVDPGCHITPYPCTRCGHWHVYSRRIVEVHA